MLAVVVGDVAVQVLARRLADVVDVALHDSEHVLGGAGVEHPPVASAGDVYRRSVGVDAAPHVVVVRVAEVVGASATRGEP